MWCLISLLLSITVRTPTSLARTFVPVPLGARHWNVVWFRATLTAVNVIPYTVG